MRWSRSVLIGIAILTVLICCVIYLLLSCPQTEGFETSIPRIIWSYWHDPEIPPKVKKILDERAEVLSKWKHHVLNETTVYDYIPKDMFPKEYDGLSHQAKSDWIRLYLLKHYGGCWMDSSIIVNSPDELEDLYSKSIHIHSELTGFYLSSLTLNGESKTYIESWFILAPVNSPLVSLWYEEFTEAVIIGFLPYKKKVFSVIDVSNIYGRDDTNTYLTIHSSLQYILRHRLKRKPTLLIVDAADTMFKPHMDCNWDSSCVISYLQKTPKENQPPYIKLRGNERDALIKSA